MRSIKILNVYLLFIITNIPLVIYGQYNGGSGGGFSSYNINQITCPSVSYPDIFAGGIEDGYNQTGITQVVCPSVIYPDIFAGGIEDGYSQTGITQVVCPPVSYPDIFAGGIEDGYNQTGITQVVCPSVSYPDIFAGGIEDGYNQTGITQVVCPSVIYPDIFAGGIEDGYSQTGITQVVCPSVSYPDIFAGGIEDGYNQTGITQVVCPPVSYPDIFAGGIEDGEASVTIFPACAPTVDFIADNLIICQGDTVNFTNLSSTGWDSWTWTFEGGTPSSSSLKDPIVVYNTPGVYSVTLLAHNSSNSLSTVKINYITVNERPVITASGSPSDICSGSSTVLSATSSLGSTSFSWSSGLGNTPNVSVTPAITTYYTVTGTASNGCTNTAIVLINVNPAPNVTAVASPSNICLGESVTITASGADNYVWSNGLGTNSYNILTPSASSTYTVTGTNSYGCSDTAIVSIAVYSSIAIDISANPSSICYGENTLLSVSGASSYTWSHGLGNSSSINVTPLTTTTYTVTGSIGMCSNTASITVTVKPIPSVNANANPSSICLGEYAELTATGANTYNWSGGLGSSATIMVSPSVSTTYTVTGYDNSCYNTATVTINITPPPNITLTASPDSICIGSNTTLIASGASNYIWSHGLGTNPNITISPTATTTYTVTGSNGSCSGTSFITVTVNATPTVVASASPMNICTGGSSTLTATGATTYSWTDGTNSYSGNNITVYPTATTTYTVTGSNGSCSGTSFITVTVNSTPTVIASASPMNICTGGSSTLTVTGATTYSWTDGTNSYSGNNITVYPTATTTYTVTGSNGSCSGTSFITVTVNATPTVIASASPMNICTGGSSTLTATGATTYSWTDGTNSYSGNNITVYPTSTTTYTVTGSNGSCSGTSFITVTVNATPTVIASASPMNICTGGSSTLTATGATTYSWTDGTNNYSGNNITVYPTATTTYTVTGSNGSCSGTSFITVTVNATPTVIASASPMNICTGGSSTLTVTGGTTYSWTDGTNSYSGNNITVYPTATTTYTVTGSNGSCSGTSFITVTVIQLPDIAVSASPSEICNGESSILIASGAVTYSWNTGATGSSITVAPSATTSYTVTGTISMCSSSASVVINVINNANATINYVNNLCDNQSTIALTAVTAGGIWLGPGIINPSTGLFNPSLAGAGTHTITYMISGQCGDTATIDIVVYPSPDATAYATDETCFNGNDGKAWVEVTDGTPPFTYLWNTFNTTSNINNLTPGVYYITVTDLHNCSDKDSIIVGPGVEECLNYHVYIPNVFAPDNMGNHENEVIKVYGKGIVSIDFSIFDRWGNLVFHTTDMEQSWDGMYKGEPALAGDYTYMLRVNFYNGKQETVSGHILLIR